MSENTKRQLPILVGGHLALIPFPMPEEDFDLMIETLHLWKRRLIEREAAPTEEAAPLACEQSKGMNDE